MKWVDDFSFEMPDYISTRYYLPLIVNQQTTTFSANITRYVPFFVHKTATFDRISIQTGAAFNGTATVRLGIFNNSAGAPNTVLLDAGTVSCTAASTNFEITINQELTRGWYWLAANCQTAATNNSFQAIASTHYVGTPMGVSTVAVNALTPYATQSVNVSTGFATASSTISTSSCYLIHLRKS